MKNISLNQGKIPVHVAIIMDGNRRWAAKRGLGPVDGHRVAAEEAIEPIIDRAVELGVRFITFWAFSTENWKRDKAEIKGLMQVFRQILSRKIKKLHQKGIRLNFLGDISKFPKDIIKKFLNGIKETHRNDKITVTFALNYGGRPEILRAVKKLVKDRIPVSKITEEFFSSYLDTADLPDPDLIIRTGGEMRLSGFLPWQSVYAEFYFSPVLWPDFSQFEFDKAVASYQKRERRFGGGKFFVYQTK
ncbi:MAG TPA: polyprenyl diphosphate synthase [Candidatus Bathyarchaeia archaeon]|nr:polyprenyl diphosphate synthase [Candidatus Bathyarchaeia archaeon]